MVPLLGYAADFDIDSYCKSVGEANVGSKTAVKKCLWTERMSRATLANLSFDQTIGEYCAAVSRDSGGSYKLLLSCIKEQSNAALDESVAKDAS